MISERWSEIHAWLRENSPKTLDSLKPPASPKSLQLLEEAVGIPLPGELVEHLQIHDGQDASSLAGLVDGWIFLDCKGIAGAHKCLARLLAGPDFKGNQSTNRDGKVKAEWWNDQWIPFLEGPGGDLMCFDMDPAPLGTPGQLITFWHAEGDRNVTAASLDELLKTFIGDLREGAYEAGADGGLEPL